LVLPTNLVSPEATEASIRVLTSLGERRTKAAWGSSFPFTGSWPRGEKAKKFLVSLWVGAETQMVPGSAADSMREARLMVSPMAV